MKNKHVLSAGIILTLVAMLSEISAAAQNATTNSLVIRSGETGPTINRDIYGQFSEHLGRGIYEGIWVGEDSSIPNTRGIRNDVVEALKKIKVPVLRWPGGCFADQYHWKDGIGPREKRPAMINTQWGGVLENNHFGTHEFMDLCEQLGAEPYICGNLGSGSVQEMMEWVEYMTSSASSPMANLRRANGHEQAWKLKCFGVGNESWGCGGNMTPEFYADNYKRYNKFVKDYAPNRLYRIACGPSGEDYRWTEVLMTNAANRMNGLSLHYYASVHSKTRDQGNATRFDEAEWALTMGKALQMENLIARHSEIMDKTDPAKKVGLIVDEWGTWFDVERDTNPAFLYQQNTLRDALVAGITLNIFNRHADRVKMANIAQTINVLQAMILTDKEKMILTPTYHVFEMFTPHQDATLLPSDLSCEDYVFGRRKIPGVSASASKDKSGAIHVTLCNLNPTRPAKINCEFQGAAPKGISGRMLTAKDMTAHNTFDQPNNLKPAPFDDAQLSGNGFTANLPPKSVVVLELK